MGNRLSENVCIGCGDPYIEQVDKMPLCLGCRDKLRAYYKAMKDRKARGGKPVAPLPWVRIVRRGVDTRIK